MAESAEKPASTNGAEEEDYMGDLSRFLPPEISLPPEPSSKKVSFVPSLGTTSTGKII